jgi:glucokinase
MILAADVGGTKTIVGLFARTLGGLRLRRTSTYPSHASRSLEALLRQFLVAGGERVTACAVGVAGPVRDGRSAIVNLPWPVDARRVARAAGVRAAHVLNDVEATAWGLEALPPRRIVSLTPRLRSAAGNAALLAPGTGLGMAILFWDGARHVPCATEGGHQGFAPVDDLQADLAARLRDVHGRTSIERVVSGPGLGAIYRHLMTVRGALPPAAVPGAPAADPNAAIARRAMLGEDPVAEEALDLFVAALGATAGDLALVARAVAGVYLGGGIPPKILPRLRGGLFLEAFRDKGRLRAFMERIPVRVILEPQTALWGAAVRAARPARSGGRA